MPSDANTDSYAPMVAEIIFVSGGQPFSIKCHEFLEGIEMNQSAEGAWTARISLWDQTGGDLEDLIVAAGQDNEILFRFGWDGPRGLSALPQFRGRISAYDPLYSAQGLQVTANIMPSTFAKTIIDRESLSWPKGVKASDVFRDLAEKRGWVTTIKSGPGRGQSAIQETQSVLDETSMAGETDTNFIHTFVLPYSSDDKGRAGFRFFIDKDQVYHFHNEHHIGTNEVVAHYQFARDAMGEVIEFEPSDMSFFTAILGGGNNLYDGVDSVGGTRTEVATDAYAGVPDQPSTVWRDGGYKTDLGSGLHGRISMTERSQELLKVRAANQYLMLSQFSYMARLKVKGTHDIDVLNVIIVDYLKRDGSRHYLSGTFLVKKITQSFGGGAWTTELELLRSGIPLVGNAVRQQADDQKVPFTTADTHDSATGGTGDKVGGTTTRVSAQPGTGTPRRAPP